MLRGDTSDGLPGVAGIGEKTAATLINRYGDLAALRAARSPTATRCSRAPSGPGSRPPRTTSTSPRGSSGWRCDAPVAEHDAALPTSVADPVLMSAWPSSTA